MADLIAPSLMTLENYYELEAAIFSGAQSVSYTHPGGGKNVTYRSMTDMLTLLRLLGVRLGVTPSGPRRTVAAFSKGYQPRQCGIEGDERFDVDGRCCP